MTSGLVDFILEFPTSRCMVEAYPASRTAYAIQPTHSLCRPSPLVENTRNMASQSRSRAFRAGTADLMALKTSQGMIGLFMGRCQK